MTKAVKIARPNEGDQGMTPWGGLKMATNSLSLSPHGEVELISPPPEFELVCFDDKMQQK